MRFEETQVSTYNPQTGVNTVEASVYMLIRGGRSHTVDIHMQQVPQMFGEAPGIVVRPSSPCCTPMGSTCGAALLSASVPRAARPPGLSGR